MSQLHCLPWDAATGLQWARQLVDLRRQGRAMPVTDSLIAATALVHDLTVVTRNRHDFSKTGVRVVDPFVDSSRSSGNACRFTRGMHVSVPGLTPTSTAPAPS